MIQLLSTRCSTRKKAKTRNSNLSQSRGREMPMRRNSKECRAIVLQPTKLRKREGEQLMKMTRRRKIKTIPHRNKTF
jgi:hypothetical protein